MQKEYWRHNWGIDIPDEDETIDEEKLPILVEYLRLQNPWKNWVHNGERYLYEQELIDYIKEILGEEELYKTVETRKKVFDWTPTQCENPSPYFGCRPIGTGTVINNNQFYKKIITDEIKEGDEIIKETNAPGRLKQWFQFTVVPILQTLFGLGSIGHITTKIFPIYGDVIFYYEAGDEGVLGLNLATDSPSMFRSIWVEDEYTGERWVYPVSLFNSSIRILTGEILFDMMGKDYNYVDGDGNLYQVDPVNATIEVLDYS